MDRELVCRNPQCSMSQEVASATRLAGDPEIRCRACGRPMEITMFPIAAVWVGQITAKYLDKSKEGGNAKDGSHWFWDKDPVSGKKTPVLVESFSQQKELCRRNGVTLPSQMPNNFEVEADGRTVKNTCGLPGTEV